MELRGIDERPHSEKNFMSILSPLKLFNADKAVCRTCGFKHKTSNAEGLLMHIFPERKTCVNPRILP